MDYSELAVKINNKTFTNEEMLKLVLSSTNGHALRIIASINPLPSNIIEAIQNRNERHTLAMLLQNGSVPLSVLNHYADLGFNEQFYTAIARNLNITEELGHKLLQPFSSAVADVLLRNLNTPTEVIETIWEKCLLDEKTFTVSENYGKFQRHPKASTTVIVESHYHPKVKYKSKLPKKVIVTYLQDYYPGITEKVPEEWALELLKPVVEEKFGIKNV